MKSGFSRSKWLWRRRWITSDLSQRSHKDFDFGTKNLYVITYFTVQNNVHTKVVSIFKTAAYASYVVFHIGASDSKSFLIVLRSRPTYVQQWQLSLVPYGLDTN